MENKPIKRSEYIAPLSRHHHAGLLFCWKIKEGLGNNVPLLKILNYINFFWESHLKEHFQEEQTLLFDRLEDDLCRPGKSDHQMIEERIRHFNSNGSETTDGYFAFAELLTQHMRFEERTLFPHLENTLPASVLQEVGVFLSAEYPDIFVDNYPKKLPS